MKKIRLLVGLGVLAVVALMAWLFIQMLIHIVLFVESVQLIQQSYP